jgi:hypothetical protein
MPRGRPDCQARTTPDSASAPLIPESEAFALNASSQIRVLPLHEAPVASVFVDRDGDVWVPNGTDSAGELKLVCPEPAEPGDQGVGDSYPWTLRLVEAAFGPLTEQTAVSA